MEAVGHHGSQFMQDEIAEAFRAAMQLGNGFVLLDSMGFQEVPGWDSLGHMNLINELETRLGIILEMDEIMAIDSVGAARSIVERKQSGVK
jgi:acyl carrier protein